MALSGRVTSIAFALVSLAGAGCARTPQVQVESLALKPGLINRNGVAYFERAGHVDGSEVRFKMKEAEVGDFLATLAVMEKGESSVRAAAFPLDIDDEVNKDEGDDKDGKKPPKTEDEKRGLKKVVLSLGGKAHEIEVGYIASAPVWRPSYRLVVHKDGQADLQAWGIVQNLSGEDWKDVSLSLVAGAPLSFQAQLGVAVIPARPIVTDQGEVMAVVPGAETSLSQAPEPPPPLVQAAVQPVPAQEEDLADGQDADEAQRPSGAGAARMKKAEPRPSSHRGAPSAPMPPMASAAAPSPSAASRRPPPPPRAISAPRDLRSLAAVAVEAGTTIYRLPEAVTVPDKSATMVMLFSKNVPGEADFLFAPDGGVPDSMQHPFRVARFLKQASTARSSEGRSRCFRRGRFSGKGWSTRSRSPPRRRSPSRSSGASRSRRSGSTRSWESAFTRSKTASLRSTATRRRSRSTEFETAATSPRR